MTPEQLHILQHALGVDQYGNGRPYRDYYCACREDSPTLRNIQEMVALGWMREGHKINEGTDQYFFVTQLGVSAMRAASPKPPKMSRAKERYRRFLNCDCGLSFGEWLKSPWSRVEQ